MPPIDPECRQKIQELQRFVPRLEVALDRLTTSNVEQSRIPKIQGIYEILRRPEQHKLSLNLLSRIELLLSQLFSQNNHGGDDKHWQIVRCVDISSDSSSFLTKASPSKDKKTADFLLPLDSIEVDGLLGFSNVSSVENKNGAPITNNPTASPPAKIPLPPEPPSQELQSALTVSSPTPTVLLDEPGNTNDEGLLQQQPSKVVEDHVFKVPELPTSQFISAGTPIPVVMQPNCHNVASRYIQPYPPIQPPPEAYPIYDFDQRNYAPHPQGPIYQNDLYNVPHIGFTNPFEFNQPPPTGPVFNAFNSNVPTFNDDSQLVQSSRNMLVAAMNLDPKICPGDNPSSPCVRRRSTSPRRRSMSPRRRSQSPRRRRSPSPRRKSRSPRRRSSSPRRRSPLRQRRSPSPRRRRSRSPDFRREASSGRRSSYSRRSKSRSASPRKAHRRSPSPRRRRSRSPRSRPSRRRSRSTDRSSTRTTSSRSSSRSENSVRTNDTTSETNLKSSSESTKSSDKNREKKSPGSRGRRSKQSREWSPTSSSSSQDTTLGDTGEHALPRLKPDADEFDIEPINIIVEVPNPPVTSDESSMDTVMVSERLLGISDAELEEITRSNPTMLPLLSRLSLEEVKNKIKSVANLKTDALSDFDERSKDSFIPDVPVKKEKHAPVCESSSKPTAQPDTTTIKIQSSIGEELLFTRRGSPLRSIPTDNFSRKRSVPFKETEKRDAKVTPAVAEPQDNSKHHESSAPSHRPKNNEAKESQEDKSTKTASVPSKTPAKETKKEQKIDPAEQKDACKSTAKDTCASATPKGTPKSDANAKEINVTKAKPDEIKPGKEEKKQTIVKESKESCDRKKDQKSSPKVVREKSLDKKSDSSKKRDGSANSNPKSETQPSAESNKTDKEKGKSHHDKKSTADKKTEKVKGVDSKHSSEKAKTEKNKSEGDRKISEGTSSEKKHSSEKKSVKDVSKKDEKVALEKAKTGNTSDRSKDKTAEKKTSVIEKKSYTKDDKQAPLKSLEKTPSCDKKVADPPKQAPPIIAGSVAGQAKSRVSFEDALSFGQVPCGKTVLKKKVPEAFQKKLFVDTSLPPDDEDEFIQGLIEDPVATKPQEVKKKSLRELPMPPDAAIAEEAISMKVYVHSRDNVTNSPNSPVVDSSSPRDHLFSTGPRQRVAHQPQVSPGLRRASDANDHSPQLSGVRKKSDVATNPPVYQPVQNPQPGSIDELESICQRRDPRARQLVNVWPPAAKPALAPKPIALTYKEHKKMQAEAAAREKKMNEFFNKREQEKREREQRELFVKENPNQRDPRQRKSQDSEVPCVDAAEPDKSHLTAYGTLSLPKAAKLQFKIPKKSPAISEADKTPTNPVEVPEKSKKADPPTLPSLPSPNLPKKVSPPKAKEMEVTENKITESSGSEHDTKKVSARRQRTKLKARNRRKKILAKPPAIAVENTIVPESPETPPVKISAGKAKKSTKVFVEDDEDEEERLVINTDDESLNKSVEEPSPKKSHRVAEFEPIKTRSRTRTSSGKDSQSDVEVAQENISQALTKKEVSEETVDETKTTEPAPVPTPKAGEATTETSVAPAQAIVGVATALDLMLKVVKENPAFFNPDVVNALVNTAMQASQQAIEAVAGTSGANLNANPLAASLGATAGNLSLPTCAGTALPSLVDPRITGMAEPTTSEPSAAEVTKVEAIAMSLATSEETAESLSPAIFCGAPLVDPRITGMTDPSVDSIVDSIFSLETGVQMAQNAESLTNLTEDDILALEMIASQVEDDSGSNQSSAASISDAIAGNIEALNKEDLSTAENIVNVPEILPSTGPNEALRTEASVCAPKVCIKTEEPTQAETILPEEKISDNQVQAVAAPSVELVQAQQEVPSDGNPVQEIREERDTLLTRVEKSNEVCEESAGVEVTASLPNTIDTQMIPPVSTCDPQPLEDVKPEIERAAVDNTQTPLLETSANDPNPEVACATTIEQTRDAQPEFKPETSIEKVVGDEAGSSDPSQEDHCASQLLDPVNDEPYPVEANSEGAEKSDEAIVESSTPEKVIDDQVRKANTPQESQPKETPSSSQDPRHQLSEFARQLAEMKRIYGEAEVLGALAMHNVIPESSVIDAERTAAPSPFKETTETQSQEVSSTNIAKGGKAKRGGGWKKKRQVGDAEIIGTDTTADQGDDEAVSGLGEIAPDEPVVTSPRVTRQRVKETVQQDEPPPEPRVLRKSVRETVDVPKKISPKKKTIPSRDSSVEAPQETVAPPKDSPRNSRPQSRDASVESNATMNEPALPKKATKGKKKKNTTPSRDSSVEIPQETVAPVKDSPRDSRPQSRDASVESNVTMNEPALPKKATKGKKKKKNTIPSRDSSVEIPQETVAPAKDSPRNSRPQSRDTSVESNVTMNEPALPKKATKGKKKKKNTIPSRDSSVDIPQETVAPVKDSPRNSLPQSRDASVESNATMNEPALTKKATKGKKKKKKKGSKTHKALHLEIQAPEKVCSNSDLESPGLPAPDATVKKKVKKNHELDRLHSDLQSLSYSGLMKTGPQRACRANKEEKKELTPPKPKKPIDPVPSQSESDSDASGSAKLGKMPLVVLPRVGDFMQNDRWLPRNLRLCKRLFNKPSIPKLRPPLMAVIQWLRVRVKPEIPYRRRTDIVPSSTKQKPRKSTKGSIVYLKNNDEIRLGTLRLHSFKVGRTEKISCLLCEHPPMEQRVLSEHYKNIHPESEVLISRLSLSAALSAINESETDSDVIPKRPADRSEVWSCRFCGELVPAFDQEILFVHISEHTGEHRWQCGAVGCSATAANSQSIKNHVMFYHSTIRERLKEIALFPNPAEYGHIFGYLCSRCNYVQMMSRQIDYHIEQAHAGEADQVAIFKVNLFVTEGTLKEEGDGNDSSQEEIDETQSSPRARSPEPMRQKPGPKSKTRVTKEEEDEPSPPRPRPGPKSKTRPVEDDENSTPFRPRTGDIEERVEKPRPKPGPKSKTRPRSEVDPDEFLDQPVEEEEKVDDEVTKVIKRLRPGPRSKTRPKCDDYEPSDDFESLEADEAIPTAQDREEIPQPRRKPGPKSKTRLLFGEDHPTEKEPSAENEPLKEKSQKTNKGGKKKAEKLKQQLKLIGELERSIQAKPRGKKGAPQTVYTPITILLGPMRARGFENGSLMFECTCRKCVFSGSSFDLFEKHIVANHPGDTWDNWCTVCSLEVPPLPSDKIPLRSALRHLDEHIVDGVLGPIPVMAGTEEEADDRATDDDSPEVEPIDAEGVPAPVKIVKVEHPHVEVETDPNESWPIIRPLIVKTEPAGQPDDMAKESSDEVGAEQFAEPPRNEAVYNQPKLRVKSMESLCGREEPQSPGLHPGEPLPMIQISSVRSLTETEHHQSEIDHSYNEPLQGSPNKQQNKTLSELLARPAILAKPRPIVARTPSPVASSLSASRSITTSAVTANPPRVISPRVPIISGRSPQKPNEGATRPVGITQKKLVAKKYGDKVVMVAVPVKSPDNPWFKPGEINREMLSEERIPDLYKCMMDVCPFATNEESVFEKHCDLHEVVGEKDRLKSWRYCAYCKEVQPRGKLPSHVKNVHGRSTFQCVYCFYRSCHKLFIYQHQQEFHPNEPKTVVACPMAVKFSPIPNPPTRETFKPFQCAHCHLKFKKIPSFLEHIQSNLPGHNMFLFTCHLCKEQYKVPQLLIKHYRKHGMFKWHCGFCPVGVDTKLQMTSHLANFHFTNPPCLFCRDDGDTDVDYGEEPQESEFAELLAAAEGITSEMMPNAEFTRDSREESVQRPKSSETELSSSVQPTPIQEFVAPETSKVAPRRQSSDADAGLADTAKHPAYSRACASERVPSNLWTPGLTNISRNKYAPICSDDEDESDGQQPVFAKPKIIPSRHPVQVMAAQPPQPAPSTPSYPPWILQPLTLPTPQTSSRRSSLDSDPAPSRPQGPQRAYASERVPAVTWQPGESSFQKYFSPWGESRAPNLPAEQVFREGYFDQEPTEPLRDPRLPPEPEISAPAVAEEDSDDEIQIIEPPNIRQEMANLRSQMQGETSSLLISQVKDDASIPLLCEDDAAYNALTQVDPPNEDTPVITPIEDYFKTPTTRNADQGKPRILTRAPQGLIELPPGEFFLTQVRTPPRDPLLVISDPKTTQPDLLAQASAFLTLNEDVNAAKRPRLDIQAANDVSESTDGLLLSPIVSVVTDMEQRLAKEAAAKRKTPAKTVPSFESPTKIPLLDQPIVEVPRLRSQAARDTITVIDDEEGRVEEVRQKTQSREFHCGYDGCTFMSFNILKVREHLPKCAYVEDELECDSCPFSTPFALQYLNHLFSHAPSRFMCEACCKFIKSPGIMQHVKKSHKKPEYKVFPFNSGQDDLDKDYFTFTPCQEPQTFHEMLEASTRSRDKTVFAPDEIDLLPVSAVFAFEAKCGLCPYSNKVRSNMLRHLKQHTQGVSVASAAVMNPCPEGRMFDQMTNHAVSSQTNQEYVEGTTEVDKSLLPPYVPEKQRYQCVVCMHITIDFAVLKQHLRALHSDLTVYGCLHCPSTVPLRLRNISIESSMFKDHLMCHGDTLYSCSDCHYFHYTKKMVEWHITATHKASDAFAHSVRKKNSSTSDVIQMRKCTYCSFSSQTSQSILEHLKNRHSIKGKFKCKICHFGFRVHGQFASHRKACHGDEKVEYERTYSVKSIEKTEEAVEPPVEIQPTWPAEGGGLRFIRGIPIETEDSETTKKRKSQNKHQYICHLCKEGLDDEDSFRQHYYIELNYVQFWCTLCTCKFFSRIDAKKHAAAEHEKAECIRPEEKQLVFENIIEKQIHEQRKKMGMAGPSAAKKKKTTKSPTKPETRVEPDGSRSPCIHCDEMVPSTYMKGHILSRHLRLYAFSCNECGITFRSEKLGASHAASAHAQRSKFIPNPRSKKLFVNEDFWKTEYGLKGKTGSFRQQGEYRAYEHNIVPCRTCRWKGPPGALEWHGPQMHQLRGNLWACDVRGCDFKAVRDSLLLTHEAKHSWCVHHELRTQATIVYETRFFCTCNAAADTEAAIIEHGDKAHQYEDQDFVVTEAMYSCGYCKIVAANWEWALKHWTEAHQPVGLSCVFRYKVAVRFHGRTYECHQCRISFKNLAVCKAHVEDHLQFYQCTICSTVSDKEGIEEHCIGQQHLQPPKKLEMSSEGINNLIVVHKAGEVTRLSELAVSAEDQPSTSAPAPGRTRKQVLVSNFVDSDDDDCLVIDA